MALPRCTRRLWPRPTMRPSCTSTDPMGMPPSAWPAAASAIAASRKGSIVASVGELHRQVGAVLLRLAGDAAQFRIRAGDGDPARREPGEEHVARILLLGEGQV